MTTVNKLKTLKIIKIIVQIIFIPMLIFHLTIIVPEYLACDKTMFEGESGIDIWGSEIDCNCESQAFGEMFFQMVTLVIIALSVLLFIIFSLIFRIKKNNK